MSQFFRDRLPKRLFSHPKFPANCGEAMAACIASIEVDMLADPAINSRFSGSTCVLATIVGNQLTCANIGDSRIILGRRVAGGDAGEIVPTEISRDHKPDLPDEKVCFAVDECVSRSWVSLCYRVIGRQTQELTFVLVRHILDAGSDRGKRGTCFCDQVR